MRRLRERPGLDVDSPYPPARREARLVASAVDAAVLLLALAAFVLAGGLVVLLQTNWMEVDPTGRERLWGSLVAGLWVFFPLVYFTVGAATTGTLGARVVGLRVVGQTGRPVGWTRAALRSVLLYPGAVGPAAMTSAGDRHGRPFHDRATRTLVVEWSESE